MSTTPAITTSSASAVTVVTASSSSSPSSSSFMSYVTNVGVVAATKAVVTSISYASSSSSSPKTNRNTNNNNNNSSVTTNATANSLHRRYIETQLLPFIYKLQKEVGWRKYKDCQAPLQEVVLALKVFQQEEVWPLSSSSSVSVLSTTTNAETIHQPSETAASATAIAPEQTVHEAIVMTFNVLIQVLHDESSIAQMNSGSSSSISSIANSSSGINGGGGGGGGGSSSSNKQIRPMELALEAIASIVIQQRYISGSTIGGGGVVDATTTSSSGSSNGSGTAAATKSRSYSTDSVASIVATTTATTSGGGEEESSSVSSVSVVSNVNDSTATTSPLSTSSSSSSTPTSSIVSTLLVRLMDSICKMSESTNDSLQMAVLTTITTIMNSNQIFIHDNCMLRTMKCMFHIYLVTKSTTVKTVAKRSILDIMKVIFVRMEAHDAVLRHHHRNSTIANGDSSTGSNSTIATTATTTTTSSTVLSSVSDIRSVPSEESMEPSVRNPPPQPAAQSRLAPTLYTSGTFPSQYHADAYYLFRSLCKLSSKDLPADMTDEQQRKKQPGRLLLNALSSLGTDPTELNSKVLSLELILVALEQFVGDAFFAVQQQQILDDGTTTATSTTNSSGSSTNKFIYLVQHYLCGSLLKNCVSNHTQVAYISQKIFFVLVYKFRGHLKQDIEVFMSNVFFRVLESPNTSFKQKALVLVSFRSICQDPNLLTQIFLNYDCDFDAMNLYKDIVHMLTKVGGKATSIPYYANNQMTSKREIEQEFELSLGAIECLVTILKAFLRALNLSSAGNDTSAGTTDIDTAGARIRTMLQLDSALASIQQLDDTATISTKNSDVDSTTDNTQEGDSTTTTTNVRAVISSFPSHSSLLSENTTTTADPERGVSTTSNSDPSTIPTPNVVESNMTKNIVDAFDRKRNAEQNFQIGVVKFTLSLKTGLQFFIDHGFVECDAKQIALFFIANKDKLDKTQMGEALGREPDAPYLKDKGIEADKGGPGFWFRILHHYAGALDFTDCMFDEAIRLFLSGFRLPGEAQKIDRIMEKFAERYTSQNPSVFPSSDTAFILGFSVIMLNTDLHNPSIKPEKRMTIDSFLRNNKGIGDNGSNVPDDVLRGIFERIKERPFSLKEDDAARERVGAQKNIFDTSVFFEGTNSLFGVSADDRKRENFKKEREEMMAVTEQLIRRRPGKSNNAASSTASENETKFNDDNISPGEVVKPMFDVTWGPMLGILSQVLECADDERSVAVCLNGFVFAIRLAAHSDMTLVRDTFVSSLAKFTFLGSIKEMKRKNVESTRTLLSVAVVDGEFLGESWLPVLQCMSQLARLRLSASGLESDDSFLMSDNSKNSSSNKIDTSRQGIFRQTTQGEAAREAEESNGKVVLEAVHEILIDKVFSSTVNLSAKSLAHFVEQLIAVSSAEIAGGSKSIIAGIEASKVSMDSSNSSGSGLSIFSLQRLVDVADYNMDIRPRLVWAQVWELMADYFVRVALHENRMVSIFAIDSLKQLSLKFLQKPELSEFNFQCSFLKPFLIVMEDKKSRDDIRELIMQCIDIIIRAKSPNLKSGWKVMFSILTLAAHDPLEKIEYLGLSILQRVLDEHLDDIFAFPEQKSSESQLEELSSLEKLNRNSSAEDFVSLCKASLSFIQTEETDSLRPFGLSMRAFCHIAIYADLLGSQRVLPPVSGAQSSDPSNSGYTYDGLSETESLGLVLWRPIFEGLANGITSTAKTSASGVGCLIQRGSVLALRSILLRHGHQLSTEQLAVVLRDTIIPLIQQAAEYDTSHVAFLTSESPSVSSIDFLVPPPPLPPSHDDPCLQKFSALNTVPKRAIGPAELLLEASFTDLRHGGDGDLRKAYLLAQKSADDDAKRIEQAFPDSWLATTASLALGLVTDVASEIVMNRHEEGQEILWPLIAEQYRRWLVGRVQFLDGDESSLSQPSWFPSEALVRIAAHDLLRLPLRVLSSSQFVNLVKHEQMSWTSLLITLFSTVLTANNQIEKMTQQNLVSLRRELQLDSTNDDESVDTPFGSGRVMSVRNDLYTDSVSQLTKVIPITIIELDFGAVLFQPVSGPPTQSYTENIAKEIPSEVNIPEAYWVHVVPTLKIRCVAAHCLQQSLLTSLDEMIPLASQDDITLLIAALKESQQCAASAVIDHDVSMAFQDALLKDWGDGIQVPSEDSDTLSRLSLHHGSAIFFLSQESGAAKAVVHILSTLFVSLRDNDCEWDRTSYAEPLLIHSMTEVLDKFLDSEKRDGHLVDYNVWRKVSEQSGKIALYCTSFAVVVIDILKTIRSLRHDDFDRYKDKFMVLLCALIRMDNSDMRQLVHEIFILHIGPYLGVHAVPLPPR